MKILVINCGSSSIKFKFYIQKQNSLLIWGQVEKIGLNNSFMQVRWPDREAVTFEGAIHDHQMGIQSVLAVLTHQEYGVLKDASEIDAVGHRVVHGGESFKRSVLINDKVMAEIRRCFELAPLHNPPNYAGIQAVRDILPDVPQVAVFDTSFHQTMPNYAFMYAIPYGLYQKYGLRRYGFHGTSHRYVSKRACEISSLDYRKARIISCHLGGGASVAAIDRGHSIDTSMGLTPVEGMIMGTRSGDLDLGVLTFIMNKEEISVNAANSLINKHSGMLGITGISSDMRDIEKAATQGDERSKLALQMYEYRIKKYVGAYAASLGHLDLIVFTGGIGENDALIRSGVCRNMEIFGLKIDEDINAITKSQEQVISLPESRVKVVVVPTDEEKMIANDTLEICRELS